MCALVTGVQTCARPMYVISNEADSNGNRWGFRQMDIAITKYIPFKFLSEESRLRLRVDILNLFNDRNYVDYNNTPSSPEYLSISRSEESRVGKECVTCRYSW